MLLVFGGDANRNRRGGGYYWASLAFSLLLSRPWKEVKTLLGTSSYNSYEPRTKNSIEVKHQSIVLPLNPKP